jgi:hypothetical protein
LTPERFAVGHLCTRTIAEHDNGMCRPHAKMLLDEQHVNAHLGSVVRVDLVGWLFVFHDELPIVLQDPVRSSNQSQPLRAKGKPIVADGLTAAETRSPSTESGQEPYKKR